MINEQQEERAALFVLGVIQEAEQREFEAELRDQPELQCLVRELQRAAGLLVLTAPPVSPPPDLRARVLQRIADEPRTTEAPAMPGLRFLEAAAQGRWKPLPVPGAWIQLLSLERERGYAVLLGKLDPGARYPAHLNIGPEDLYILTGDLHVGARRLGPGDFHHAEGGSWHEVNHSVDGCTLLSVLPAEHPLVAAAMA